MFINALFFLLGSFITFAGLAIFGARWVNGLIKNGHYASARYDKKKDQWRLMGSFGGIAQKLVDIRQGRQPGSIKYVD